ESPRDRRKEPFGPDPQPILPGHDGSLPAIGIAPEGLQLKLSPQYAQIDLVHVGLRIGFRHIRILISPNDLLHLFIQAADPSRGVGEWYVDFDYRVQRGWEYPRQQPRHYGNQIDIPPSKVVQAGEQLQKAMAIKVVDAIDHHDRGGSRRCPADENRW